MQTNGQTSTRQDNRYCYYWKESDSLSQSLGQVHGEVDGRELSTGGAEAEETPGERKCKSVCLTWQEIIEEFTGPGNKSERKKS